MSNESKFNGNVEVKAEMDKKSTSGLGNIIIKVREFSKVIPTVLFTPKEAKNLLEIVDKVEKDTNANIIYK